MKANKLSLRTVIAAGMVGAVFTLAALPADAATLSYSCNRYVKGQYAGSTNVSASNQAEAERLAGEKFRKLGMSYDYVKCW